MFEVFEVFDGLCLVGRDDRLVMHVVGGDGVGAGADQEHGAVRRQRREPGRPPRAKETLYRHFGTKEGLVEAMLRQRSERVAQWLTAAAEAAGDDPRDQLAALQPGSTFRGSTRLTRPAARGGRACRTPRDLVAPVQ
ncbi:TetR/AcrR family transcriptional regulator [Nonomuraea sp. NPDC048916]|uniref:TetR/AcrR family transcriptional regulator n=1 Tax=Nonomuraea sp. NPDC048916 TaxID=3154232 RepID=UPI0033D276C8